MAEPEATPPPKDLHSGGPVMTMLGVGVRITMIIPVIATFVASVALIIYGAIETWHFLTSLFGGEGHAISRDEALFLAIEIVDLFLLATVVQVVSLGLYQLYFNQDLQLPKWLKIEDLDDLKSKLAAVVATVLAVFFLGKAITYEGGIDILYLGVGAAAVIVALTYFLQALDDH